MVKTTENAVCVVYVLPYLCMMPSSAPIKSGLTGGREYWSQTDKRCGGGVLEEFKHGVVYVRMSFGHEFIVMM
jgi:hypothetical protein